VILKNKNITLTSIFIGRRKVKLFIFTSGLMITREQQGLDINYNGHPRGLIIMEKSGKEPAQK
jgi:hypothetical protein